METPRPKMMTVAQAAGALGVTEKVMRSLLSSGDIAHHRYGRGLSVRIRVEESEIDAYLERTRVERVTIPQHQPGRRRRPRTGVR